MDVYSPQHGHNRFWLIPIYNHSIYKYTYIYIWYYVCIHNYVYIYIISRHIIIRTCWGPTDGSQVRLPRAVCLLPHWPRSEWLGALGLRRRWAGNWYGLHGHTADDLRKRGTAGGTCQGKSLTFRFLFFWWVNCGETFDDWTGMLLDIMWNHDSPLLEPAMHWMPIFVGRRGVLIILHLWFNFYLWGCPKIVHFKIPWLRDMRK